MNDASKRDEILDVSEAMIRRLGFNGFSTRDVAMPSVSKRPACTIIFRGRRTLARLLPNATLLDSFRVWEHPPASAELARRRSRTMYPCFGER